MSPALRGALAVGVAAVLALGLARAGDGGRASARPFVTTTRNFVAAIGMDGPVLAYDVIGGFDRKARKGYCNRVFAVDVNTRAVVQVSSETGRTCHAGESRAGAGIFQVAVAGTRIAWLDDEGGRSEDDRFLFGSSLARPGERTIATGISRAGGSTSAMVGLVGDRGLVAVSTLTRAAHSSTVVAALRRVGPARLAATVRTGPSAVVSQAADAGRVVVLTPGRRAVLYSEAGKLLRSWAAPSATEAALESDTVVLLDRGKLEVESAARGTHVKTIRIRPGAYSLDVHSGIAVYATRHAIHAVRLSSGRDVVVASVPNPVVAATVEAPGLAYAWGALRAGTQIGRLAFVPLAQVRARLG